MQNLLLIQDLWYCLSMDEIKELIQGGIQFEEKLIAELVQDIKETQEFEGISAGKKDKILPVLAVLKNDSLRHKTELEQLVKKY